MAAGTSHGPDAFPLQAICDAIASGQTFEQVAFDQLIDASTLRRWLLADPQRAERYLQARQERGHKRFDELDDVMAEAMECKDKVKIQAYKLKIDTLKWIIGKLNPREYGDKQQIEHSGSIETRTDDQVRARLDALLAKAQGREA